MKFKYSAFTNNTPEIREWLDKLGYKYSGGGWLIITNGYSYMITSIADHVLFKKAHANHVNCLDNPDLFKAVIAINDENDYMQWFTDGKEWILCEGEDFCKWVVSCHKFVEFSLDTIHQATLEELQEHFKIEDK